MASSNGSRTFLHVGKIRTSHLLKEVGRPATRPESGARSYGEWQCPRLVTSIEALTFFDFGQIVAQAIGYLWDLISPLVIRGQSVVVETNELRVSFCQGWLGRSFGLAFFRF